MSVDISNDNGWILALKKSRDAFSAKGFGGYFEIGATNTEPLEPLDHCISCGAMDGENNNQYRARVDLMPIDVDNFEENSKTVFSIEKTIRGCLCQFCKEEAVVVYAYDSATGRKILNKDELFSSQWAFDATMKYSKAFNGSSSLSMEDLSGIANIKLEWDI